MTDDTKAAARRYAKKLAEGAPSLPRPGALGNEPTPNPFGKWTQYRAKIAAMSRPDAADPEAEREARQLLKAARLADQILAIRDELSRSQRAMLRGLL